MKLLETVFLILALPPSEFQTDRRKVSLEKISQTRQQLEYGEAGYSMLLLYAYGTDKSVHLYF